MEDNERNMNDESSVILGKVQDNVTEPEAAKKQSRRKAFFRTTAICLISALLGGICGGYITAGQVRPETNDETNVPLESNKDVNINLNEGMYFAEAVAGKSQDTVVGITSDVEKQVNTFFGPQVQKGQSMGSGFIIDSNGYIVTNAHVIGDGEYKNITVSLADGSTEPGEVLWYDSAIDLAIVKINKTGLHAAEIGDSDELAVGQPVVAIGNPMTLDLERTVTQGIISGLNRSIALDDGSVMEPLIQTDASINSGNSGGPLLNAKGQVIGINTAKMSSAEGLGFSIPINTAKPILEQIIKTGKFSTVYLGITGVDVETYEKALGVDIKAEYGVVVVEATKDSPAYEAGLQNGDVITAIDGEKVESMVSLKKKLYSYKEGDKASLTISRNGEEKTIEVILKIMPEGFGTNTNSNK